jgi:DNA-binding MurR/RpiR family transcriptional regulator
MQSLRMRGRPKRSRDADIAERLIAFRALRKKTDAAIAQDLDVHPATICRAMKTLTFSEDLKSRLDDYLPLARSAKSEMGTEREYAMHILQEFMQSLPKLENALDILLDVRRDEE